MKIQIFFFSVLAAATYMLYCAEQQIDVHSLAGQSDLALSRIVSTLSDTDLDSFASVSHRMQDIAQREFNKRPNYLWEKGVITREVIGAHEGQVYAAYVANDGSIISVDRSDRRIKVWDGKTYQELRQIVDTNESGGIETAFSPTNNLIALLHFDHIITVWNIQTKEKKNQLTYPGALIGVSFSPDGTKLAASGIQNAKFYMVIFDLISGKQEQFDLGVLASYKIVFSPDGKSIAYVVVSPGLHEKDYSAHVRDIKTSAIELSRDFSKIPDLHVTPQGELVGYNVRDKKIDLFDVKTGKEIVSFACSNIPAIYQVKLSNDAQLLAAFIDGQLVIGDIKTKKIIRKLTNKKELKSIAFSPDDTTVVAGYADGSLIVWKATPRAQ